MNDRQHYYDQGFRSCWVDGNYWLGSCPYAPGSWQADAWKDGNWAAQQQRRAKPPEQVPPEQVPPEQVPRRIRKFSVTSTKICTEV